MKKVLCVLFGFVLGIGAVIFAVTRFITKDHENKTIELIRTDILLPSIRNTVYALFWGDLPEKRGVRYFNYGGNYKSPYKYVTPYHIFSNKVKDPRFDTKKLAEEVLNKLHDIAINYNFATIADLCDLTGESYRFTDSKYGWTEQDLQDVSIKRTGKQYTLCMPRPMEV